MRDENAEIIFEVTKAPEGGYDAQSIGRGIFFIFAQGDDWQDLKGMVRDVVDAISQVAPSPA